MCTGSTRNKRSVAALVLVIALWSGVCAKAVASAAVDATSAYMVIPLTAQTASFVSDIFVFNPHADYDLALNVDYVGGDGTLGVGLKSCGGILVPALKATQFSVGTKCALSAAGGHFGMVRIYDTMTTGSPFPLPFHAYSRVANPQGIGFSVPAYPNAVFQSGISQVIGLKRQAASPTYQSNCFIGSRDDSVLVQISLYSPDDVQIGSTLSKLLAANQFVRYLDIFTAVGAAPGDHTNVRAQFETFLGTALIAFCTVQDNTSFGADFRIAGETQPSDVTRMFETNYGEAASSFSSYGQKAVYYFVFRSPDKARCRIITSGGGFANLEMRIKDPSNVVIAGGDNQTDTGLFTVASGGVWTLEVSVREGVTPTYPLLYGVECGSGNGHGQIGVTFSADDF